MKIKIQPRAINNQVYYNIDEIRARLVKKGGKSLLEDFDRHIRPKPGCLVDNCFYIQESDYKEWERRLR
jgi:inhibitor of KinA sporulation pathway (predicted exonuclease)